jgi:hypothetical protein
MHKYKPSIDCGINSFLDPTYLPLDLIYRSDDEIETALCTYMKMQHTCTTCHIEIHIGGASYDCNHQLCLDCIYKILCVPDDYAPKCPVCKASLLRIKYRMMLPGAPIKPNKSAETAIYAKWMSLNRMSVNNEDIMQAIAARNLRQGKMASTATATTTTATAATATTTAAPVSPIADMLKESETADTSSKISEVQKAPEVPAVQKVTVVSKAKAKAPEAIEITGNPEIDLTDAEYDELIDRKISQNLEDFTYMVPKIYMNNLSALMSHRDELLLRYHPYNLLSGDATLADVNLCIMMVSKAKAGLINAIGFDDNIKEWIERLTKKDQIHLVLGIVRTTYEFKRRVFSVLDELKASGFPDKFDKIVLEKLVRKHMGNWCVSGEIELVINSINLARKVDLDDIELYGEQTVEEMLDSEKINEFIQKRKKGQGLSNDRKEILKDMQYLMKTEPILGPPGVVVNNDVCQIIED